MKAHNTHTPRILLPFVVCVAVVSMCVCVCVECGHAHWVVWSVQRTGKCGTNGGGRGWSFLYYTVGNLDQLERRNRPDNPALCACTTLLSQWMQSSMIFSSRSSQPAHASHTCINACRIVFLFFFFPPFLLFYYYFSRTPTLSSLETPNNDD